ncbi:MAG: hypothetical protein U0M15_05995 [Bacillota bacterium]|nr:hypothetical protein [Bacillota bacterium]
MERIVEAYIGEYASGKSENAVNRAIALKKAGRDVTLVDLDLVEPVYTLRPLKAMLTEMGINVIAWTTEETLGLGEAGSVLHPAMRWALRNKGDVILDIGYGARGSSILNLLEGVNDEKNFRVILVVNALRPMTDTVEKIVEYHNESGPAHGLIANTHMGDDTELPQIIKGYEIVKEVSQILQIPIDALAVDQRFAKDFPDGTWDHVPVRVLERFLPKGFW